MYLLDTNAVSEWVKPRPDAGLLAWYGSLDDEAVFLSVATLAELRDGVERLPAGPRRSHLERWLDAELVDRFGNRILDVGIRTAEEWGRIVARRRKAGRPIGVMDALIAATAAQHDLAIVTRNVTDFEELDIPLVCPWSG